MGMGTQTGGHRRIDRVLAPGFLAGLERLNLDELRARRVAAESEEADLSYLRRLLHGRLDILRAELARRAAGAAGSVVALLPAILGPRDTSTRPRFTALPRLRAPVPNRRRRLERLVCDETMARLPDLSTSELHAAVERLTRAEAVLSNRRHAVQRVVDALRSEVIRRYRDGTARVGDLIDSTPPSGTSAGHSGCC